MSPGDDWAAGRWRSSLVNCLHVPHDWLTSAVLVAEIRESPDVSESDTVADARQHELGWWRPLSAISRRRLTVVITGLWHSGAIADMPVAALWRCGPVFTGAVAAATARLTHAPCERHDDVTVMTSQAPVHQCRNCTTQTTTRAIYVFTSFNPLTAIDRDNKLSNIRCFLMDSGIFFTFQR